MSSTTKLIARRFAIAFAAFAMAAVLLPLLYRYNPSMVSILPPCLFHELTGLHCPGCGATRAVHQLLHGHLLAAFRYNPLFIIALPFISYALVLDALGIKKRSMVDILTRPKVGWFILAVVIAFWILRNIPIYPFTLLAPMGGP